MHKYNLENKTFGLAVQLSGFILTLASLPVDNLNFGLSKTAFWAVGLVGRSNSSTLPKKSSHLYIVLII